LFQTDQAHYAHHAPRLLLVMLVELSHANVYCSAVPLMVTAMPVANESRTTTDRTDDRKY